MPRFAIRTPYLIIVACLVLVVVGVTSVVRMPVDMFPAINIPVVVVATFYTGMPPEQIETDITSRFERFFTLASGVEHIESRSLTGVSVIKVYFQPGTNADSDVTAISNLAMANLRHLPPGTLPPVVLKFDASSLPACLVTLSGEGLNETSLRDQAQYNVRNQLAGVPGASVPQPFGGVLRQIMVYVDPFKLEAYGMSPMDLVRQINEANLILPAGDVRIGSIDYNIYANSQLPSVLEINDLPIKVIGPNIVRVSDVGQASDSHLIQTNIVRVNGQRSVYLPVLKQGGDTNTIAVVDGIRSALTSLVDVPRSLVTKVVFDQSRFVKTAIATLVHEGAIGLFLTSLMILIFLGSMRATVAVFFSIPISTLTTFLALQMTGNSINAMVLGGLALAFSRLIDNSVVVLENIHRHMEMGASPAQAAERGANEVALPVLAATLTTAIVFFPVTFLYGVSRFLFSALALTVVLALFASYFVALTVVPLFGSRFLKPHSHHASTVEGLANEVAAQEAEADPHDLRAMSASARFNRWFNARFETLLRHYDHWVKLTVQRPRAALTAFGVAFAAVLLMWPLLDLAYFPRTDSGQFVINLKTPSGTRLTSTEGEVARVENVIRHAIPKDELRMIVSNIGIVPGFSSIYNPNASTHTAFVQVSLREGHRRPTEGYMRAIAARLREDMPDLRTFFSSGGLVEAVLNMGMPAPIDVQVTGSNQKAARATAGGLAERIRRLPEVAQTYIPQDLDMPSFKLDVDRARTGELGLTTKEVVDNLITALTSNTMIAPSFWMDPKTGYDYMLTVQFPEKQIHDLADLRAIPLRAVGRSEPTRLDMISNIRRIESPSEVDHYQLQRAIDVFVETRGEDLSRTAGAIDKMVAAAHPPEGVRVALRGTVQGMRTSFRAFGLGLLLAIVLLYLVLVAQFKSFLDPAIILVAVPPAVMGVILVLWATATSLNIMSLMGVVMLAGMAVSNSILIVEFAKHLQHEGASPREAVMVSCRIRLRPVLMTSLATIIGLLPMAMKLGEGSEAYAPLARAIIGGLTVSVALTIFLVPAAYVLIYRQGEGAHA
jgi:multidrug efflux pump subunit AcrB